MTSLMNEQTQSWSQHLTDNNSNSNNSVELEDELSSMTTSLVRKRTRATADQLSVLEDTFAVNVSPNSKLRKQLAEQLQMSERSIQIWFQNRRAKVKHVQKKAQMQMHQASIRAQLFQYQQHQQVVQQVVGQPPMQPYQHPYYYNTAARLSVPQRAQSVDAVQNHHFNNTTKLLAQHHHDLSFIPPLPSYSATPPPMSYPQFLNQQQQQQSWITSSLPPDALRLSRQSMPPQVFPHDLVDPSTLSALEFPEYIHGQFSPSPSPLQSQQKSSIPTLVSVPDAGPTAILTTSQPSTSPSIQSTTLTSPNSTHQSNTINLTRTSTTPGVPTVDPSNLLINTIEKEKSSSPEIKKDIDEEEPKDLYLSATTLTIGTWHRLKMQETDLVCVYRPDTRIFAWHIVDGGCHFKMEVPQHAVSSIEFILDETFADVHFDISEPPLFYMESNTTTTLDKKQKKKNEESNNNSTTIETSPVWVQCSDFTEGKQASRFFRHTLKGVAHHMKQELMALINNHEETRRLVQFIDNRSTFIYQPLVESQPLGFSQPLIQSYQPEEHLLLQQPSTFINPNTLYWSTQTMNEPIASELYMS